MTGIDLPAGSAGGSVELLYDLYLDPRSALQAEPFMLAPLDPSTGVRDGIAPLHVDGKALSGPDFWGYVDRLGDAIRKRFAGADPEVVHLQHVAFGATPALLKAFPDHPAVALVHGTDILFAARHPTQAEVLRVAVAAASAVVVPTTAMADRLRLLAPELRDVVHIPWGIPDQLVTRDPNRSAARAGVLRVLYAGRLTAEKLGAGLIAALTELPGVEVSFAAPTAQTAELARRVDLSGARHIGWLPRRRLWDVFARYDLLVVPSVELEAFGLVAVEAQACGLPVAFQPVPGLVEVLGDSALPVDFRDLRDVAAAFQRLIAFPDLLDDLRTAGRANSARFLLSRTVGDLAELSASLVR